MLDHRDDLDLVDLLDHVESLVRVDNKDPLDPEENVERMDSLDHKDLRVLLDLEENLDLQDNRDQVDHRFVLYLACITNRSSSEDQRSFVLDFMWVPDASRLWSIETFFFQNLINLFNFWTNGRST